MGILTQIIAAGEDEIEAIGEALNPADEWEGVERRDVDIPKLATLHSVLTGDLFDDALVLYEPIYVSPSEGAFVLRFSDLARERLAELDEVGLAEVARELSATEEFEYADWDPEEVADWLTELADLARTSDAQGWFVWMHPLRT